ncbi:MAG: PIN domain-containing protein [Prevotellaceae bacterium]|nr:PIN domain-containing protein [Prevotellaceae bacterium]
MRLYLDTNMLIAIVTGKRDRIDDDTSEILFDYSNLLYTSAACVHELIYLLQAGKVERGKDWRKGETVLERIAGFEIEVVPIDAKHLAEEERLPLLERHKDPIDRLIVAHAIADKAMLVSSDGEFPRYVKYGLLLHRNWI